MSRDVIARIIQDLDSSQGWYISAVLLAGQISCWLKLKKSEQQSESLSCVNLKTAFQTLIESSSESSQSPIIEKVFQDDRISKLPEPLGTQLIESLIEADQRGLLNYSEIPKALAEQLNHCQDDQRPWVLPDEVARLMLSLLERPKGSSLYCPFSQSVTLLAAAGARQTTLEFCDSNLLASISLLLGDNTYTQSFTDPLKQPAYVEPGALQRFDYSACCTPTKQRYRVNDLNDLYGRFPEQPLYGDVIHIRHLMSQTLKRSAVVVSSAMLQRTKGKEKAFKYWLLENGFVRAIIKLPSCCIPGYRNTASLLVLDRQEKNDKVILFDASKAYFHQSGKNGLQVLRNADAIVEALCNNSAEKASKDSPNKITVSVAEIIENDTNLDISRYRQTNNQKASGGRQTLPLFEVAELIRAQALPQSSGSPARHFLEAAPADITLSGEVMHPDKALAVSSQSLPRALSQKLKAGDIVLTIKGNTGKVGLVPSICGDNWVAGQAFQIIRLRPDSPIKDSRILFQYLTSEAGQHYLNSIRSGTSVAFLQTRDIQQMPIPMMTSEEQSLALQSWQEIKKIHAEIALLREKIDQQHNALWISD
ncbi:N-6 DNA methylase [Parendozoicomonas haliclonae]|uniref:site-specific DNA-methyltransferase (adenine-specific) n=1 Tax=Parendozoicomonas haliclonae TaxID=1960125 RepID=A0A1X7AJ02_9GAMM|nr:N-6 DNA methylase [Parendozoicomonas haliclonae]SMA39966.1 N-6 DNA Methylase [Parendozoicomonas haliclonae]